MKKLTAVFVFFSLVTVLIAACSGSSGDGSVSGPAVHMNDTNFVQSNIAIKKGDKLTLIDDVAVTHVIVNGMWDRNGTAKPKLEGGAPLVNATFNGNDSQTIGPFNTAGTYHLYCTIHPEMNLTVTVQ